MILLHLKFIIYLVPVGQMKMTCKKSSVYHQQVSLIKNAGGKFVIIFLLDKGKVWMCQILSIKKESQLMTQFF